MNIPLGLSYSQTLRVGQSLTVPSVSDKFTAFADMPPVFATAFLVGFVESTCVEALESYLDPDYKTVGVHVNISHCAATPIGMNVTAEIKLTAVDGNHLTFDVRCHDEIDLISSGTHERYIVHADRFLTKVAQKQKECQ